MKATKTKKTQEKKPQVNIKEEKKAKKPGKHLLEPKASRSEWHDYDCMISFKQKPVNDAFLSKFAVEWSEYALNDPDYITIWEYPVMQRGMLEETVTDWGKRNADVANALKYVRLLCKIRRDKGAAKRELDGSYVSKTMPMYCNETRDLEEWRARLSEKIAAAGGIKVVEIPAFGDADLLPYKKDKK